MENKGITKKQYWIQLSSAGFNVLLAIYWIVWGIVEKKTFMLVFGVIFLVLAAVLVISLVVQLKRHRVEDPEADEVAVHNFKDGLKGSGIVIGLIVFFFLLAFGLVALLK